MSNWKYELAYLAWENKITGELSITNPEDSVELVTEDKAKLQQDHDDLATLSLVSAVWGLYPDIEKAKKAILVVYGRADEQVDRCIERVAKWQLKK